MCRNCEGCCNNNLDKSSILSIDRKDLITFIEDNKFEELILTGGEPLKDYSEFNKIVGLSDEIAYNLSYRLKVILYSSNFDIVSTLLKYMSDYFYGMTMTVHDNSDIDKVNKLTDFIKNTDNSFTDMRLNIVDGIDCKKFTMDVLKYWRCKNIKWKEECPLPSNEMLAKLNWDY